MVYHCTKDVSLNCCNVADLPLCHGSNGCVIVEVKVISTVLRQRLLCFRQQENACQKVLHYLPGRHY